ncbi:uncharacterized protein ACA1_093780 [Acanthamoeba castellanii str. Neff]|uniref:Uncharacterized protein n=1 Tax=Acanthamoeba castellanii (strain ATCC 30010 / Neff) TaxID=1257118 RepID=L8GKV4_ACACF|nr:uncharacterized protein ACA1_093780 [Acanthamoeba castellanii str. Neff]ELR12831.1 hypothetical protein ACA1_093780 [Acanthamoeba castellanii str. Neff]
MDHTPRHNQLFHFFTLRSVLPTSSMPQWAGWLVALALTFALYALYHHAPSALFGPTSDVDAGDGAVDEPGTSDNHDQAAGDTFSQTQFLAWMAAQANAAPAWPAEWAKLDALLWGQGLEGHMEAEQAHYYAAVGRLPFVRTVCEIGFNAGHSATVWLTSQPGLRLQSFDIGLHGLELVPRPLRRLAVAEPTPQVVHQQNAVRPGQRAHVDQVQPRHLAEVPAVHAQHVAHEPRIALGKVRHGLHRVAERSGKV